MAHNKVFPLKSKEGKTQPLTHMQFLLEHLNSAIGYETGTRDATIINNEKKYY